MITHNYKLMSLLAPVSAFAANSKPCIASHNWRRGTAAKLMIVFLAGVIASGCSSRKKDLGVNQDYARQQVEELYKKGKKALDTGNYSFAIEYYRALEASFPFGEHTEQAKLDMIYAFNKTDQSEKAIEAANNFIALYPTHKNVDYAYYMKGVSTFQKKAGRFDRFIKGSGKAIRDPKPYIDSMEAFEELLKRYPQSTYADDSKQRIVFIHNELANRELKVAQFYFDNKTFVAAVNRCKHIIYRYETSPAVEGALKLMERAYVEMGLNDLAVSTHDVLLANFPDNEKEIYRKKKSFFGRLNPFN